MDTSYYRCLLYRSSLQESIQQVADIVYRLLAQAVALIAHPDAYQARRTQGDQVMVHGGFRNPEIVCHFLQSVASRRQLLQDTQAPFVAQGLRQPHQARGRFVAIRCDAFVGGRVTEYLDVVMLREGDPWS